MPIIQNVIKNASHASVHDFVLLNLGLKKNDENIKMLAKKHFCDTLHRKFSKKKTFFSKTKLAKNDS